MCRRGKNEQEEEEEEEAPHPPPETRKESVMCEMKKAGKGKKTNVSPSARIMPPPGCICETAQKGEKTSTGSRPFNFLSARRASLFSLICLF